MKTHQQLLLKLTTILFFAMGSLFPIALASIGILTKSHGYQNPAVKKSALNKYVPDTKPVKRAYVNRLLH